MKTEGSKLLSMLSEEMRFASDMRDRQNRNDSLGYDLYEIFLKKESSFIQVPTEKNHVALDRAGLEVALIGESKYLLPVKLAVEAYQNIDHYPHKTSLKDVVNMINRHTNSHRTGHDLVHKVFYASPLNEGVPWEFRRFPSVESLFSEYDGDQTASIPINKPLTPESFDAALKKDDVRKYFPGNLSS